jgi:hypothetical protein
VSRKNATFPAAKGKLSLHCWGSPTDEHIFCVIRQ